MFWSTILTPIIYKMKLHHLLQCECLKKDICLYRLHPCMIVMWDGLFIFHSWSTLLVLLLAQAAIHWPERRHGKNTLISNLKLISCFISCLLSLTIIACSDLKSNTSFERKRAFLLCILKYFTFFIRHNLNNLHSWSGLV